MEARGPRAEPRVPMAPTEELVHGEQGTELLEEVLGRGNMLKALARVEGNRGAAGVDGMEVGELRYESRQVV